MYEHLTTEITETPHFTPLNIIQNIGFLPHYISSLIRQKRFVRRNW